MSLICPNCRSEDCTRERRPNGNSHCRSCGLTMPSAKWDELAPVQHGSLLIFKPDTTREQIDEVLQTLGPILEKPAAVYPFNPKQGSPVWYIP